jgi:hypothetical protein
MGRPGAGHCIEADLFGVPLAFARVGQLIAGTPTHDPFGAMKPLRMNEGWGNVAQHSEPCHVNGRLGGCQRAVKGRSSCSCTEAAYSGLSSELSVTTRARQKVVILDGHSLICMGLGQAINKWETTMCSLLKLFDHYAVYDQIEKSLTEGVSRRYGRTVAGIPPSPSVDIISQIIESLRRRSSSTASLRGLGFDAFSVLSISLACAFSERRWKGKPSTNAKAN